MSGDVTQEVHILQKMKEEQNKSWQVPKGDGLV